MIRRVLWFVGAVALALLTVGSAAAEEVEGEWTLVPLTVAVETARENDVLGQAERVNRGEFLTLGLPFDNTPLEFRIDRQAGTMALFGEAVPYTRQGDRYVAAEDAMHIEFLFTPIGDAVLCQIVYRWPTLNAIVIAEAIPGADGAVIPFGQ